MMKTIKRIIWCMGFFVLGAFLGWFLYDFMIFLLNTEKIEFIYTSLPEIFFLKLKVVGLFGFMSVAIFIGTTAPKILNRLKRFLIIFIPSITMCGIILAERKALLYKIHDINNFGVQSALTVSGLKMELVPFSGLLAAIVIIAFLFKRSGQQQL